MVRPPAARLKKGLLPALLLALVAAELGASPCPPIARIPPIADAELDATVFLAGDAGAPDLRGDPLLEALGRELLARAELLGGERAWAVFLGDNVYPRGLPPAGRSGHLRQRVKLDAQLSVFRAAPGQQAPRGLFLPGNHDWDRGGRRGWARVREQGTHLASRGGERVKMLPAGGCPGPAVEEVGSRLLLVALDTQWWLHPHDKPRDPGSGCPADSEPEVVAALAAALGGAGERHALVVAHHPLASGGPHGQPRAARRRSDRAQDLTSPPYSRMREALAGTLARHPPLLVAAGHDHGLQLLAGPGFPYQAVSGSGSKLSRVTALPETIFCMKAHGLLRLDLARDGRARLAVLALAGRGGLLEEVASYELAPGGRR